MIKATFVTYIVTKSSMVTYVMQRNDMDHDVDIIENFMKCDLNMKILTDPSYTLYLREIN